MSSAMRLLRPGEEEVLSLEVLARRPEEERAPATQFRVLVRHFLERFFTGEVSGVDGDTRTRVVQAACALGLPPFVLCLYLYPAYHLPHHAARPYWAMAGDHYFFVVYAMAAMGLVTIFEWDLLFPDMLDIYLLSTLPVPLGRLLRSRIAAIFLLMGGALFDSSFLAPLVLPAATDPPQLFRFLAAHVAAVTAAGIFGAASLLALEGLLTGVFGSRIFRRVSLWLQGACVVALLTLLFLYPVTFGALRGLTESGSGVARWLPPFWFLGIYQWILGGGATPTPLVALARFGMIATVAAVAMAGMAYPLAWWRSTRGLVEGVARRERGRAAAGPIQRLLHAVAARRPSSRAIWHFIGQNLLRVPRYRMVLVLYGGMGAALVLATVMRVRFTDGDLELFFSRSGLRVAIPIVAFWTVAGLRSTFLAPADQGRRWVFRVTMGRAGTEEMATAQRWVFLWSLLLSLLPAAAAAMAQPRTGAESTGAMALTGAALSLLLTDVFFLNVTTVPFTGTRAGAATNPALLLIPYLGFFPVVVFLTASAEAWMERSARHLGVAAVFAVAIHLCLAEVRRARLEAHLEEVEPDEDEEEFPMRLGLR